MKHDTNNKAQLVTGPVRKILVKLTIPMIFGTLSMVIFNLVDTFFVGQLGTNQLAALSFTFPVVLVVTSLALGMGVGASAVISRAIGQGNIQQVKRLTTDSLVLSVLVVAIFVVFGIATIDPLFRALGASGVVLEYVKSYMQIWYFGVLFVVVPMVGNNAIRATGDTKTPAIIMMTAAGLNAFLDPLLIFGLGPFPRLEIAGAAIATVIGRATTLVVSLSVLHYRERMLTFELPTMTKVLESWKQILYIGLPTAGTRIVIPIGIGVLTRLLAFYGPEAVAAYGVGTRIEFFALTVIRALSTVLGPFIGQNWGAGKFDRIRRGVQASHRFALIWGAGGFIVLALLARTLGAIFNNNPSVIAIIAIYLWLVPIGYGCYGLLLLDTSAMNVLKRPIPASAVTMFQMFALNIPLAYLGSVLFGVWGIFLSIMISYCVSGFVAYGVLKRIITQTETAGAL